MIPVRTVLLAAMLMVSMPAQAQQSDPYQSWARVLARFVSERGEVDFRALSRERGDLDAFVGYVARVSPRSAPDAFPSKDAKLAYYINAYNALAMYNVIDSDFPKSLDGWRKMWFFGVKRFAVGGERMSLYALENDVIRPLGDERVHYALNCMVVSCPRLPRVAFTPEKIDRQLDDEARRFFVEARNLQVLADRKRVRMSALLKFYTEDFLAKSPTLIAYVNRYAPAGIAASFEVEFMDYDWTVNDQSRGVARHESR